MGGGICPLLGHIEGVVRWFRGGVVGWWLGHRCCGCLGLAVSLVLSDAGVLWGVSLLLCRRCVGRCLGSGCTFGMDVCFYWLVLSLLRLQ